MRSVKSCKTQAAIWLVRGRNENPNHRAVIEKAAYYIGEDIKVPELKERLRRAVLLSCDDGRKYTYRYLNIDFVSERDFYRRRNKFLMSVYSALME